MEPRYDPHTGGQAAGPWAPQPGAYGPAPAEGGADDALVRLGSWALALVAGGLLAAGALVCGGLLYGAATWRRWA